MSGEIRWSNVEFAGPSMTKGPMPNLPASRINLQGPETYHMPRWKGYSDPRRVALLRRIALTAGRDPRMRHFTINHALARRSDLDRQYKRQAEIILAWVQNNVRYFNEAGEILQDPFFTLKVGYGDCDDLSLLVAAMYESIRLPWRFVLSGTDTNTGQSVRWIEGQPPPPRSVKFAHVYVCVGRPPFQPKRWSFADPSLKGAPLGWDVVRSRQRGEKLPLPELGEIVALVPTEDGGLTPSSEKDSIWAELAEQLSWRRVLVSAIVGSVTLATTSFLLERGASFFRRRRKGRARG